MCESAQGIRQRSRSAGSGDILADRRFAYAMAASAEGDPVAAADLLEQTVEIAPAWAGAWLELALARVAARLDGVEEALSRAVALDPTGELGADLHLARLAGRRPDTLGEAHVRALFDDYAPRYEAHLVGALGYEGPRVLAALLEGVAPGRRFARGLDVGCGTGLVARALAARVEGIDGVDLAPAMVARARATGLYGRVEEGEAVAALAREAPGGRDLVVAADVLCYLGALDPVFAGVSSVLAPDGVFLATCQSRAGDDWGLADDLRFAHSAPYVRDRAAAAGLVVLALEEASVRRDNGAPVPGLAMALARRAPG